MCSTYPSEVSITETPTRTVYGKCRQNGRRSAKVLICMLTQLVSYKFLGFGLQQMERHHLCTQRAKELRPEGQVDESTD